MDDTAIFELLQKGARMRDYLLTIIIPTFNRVKNLSLLLSTLKFELRGCVGQVNVIIGDNASTDNTAKVTKAFQSSYPDTLILRHPENLGPEENFCRCVDQVQSRYFWIIGDDDLPKRGVLEKIIKLLSRHAPSLVYMQSEWVDLITSSEQGVPIDKLNEHMIGALEAAHQVHVFFTYISGVIVDRSRLNKSLGGRTIREFSGTSLVQLGWVLPLLKNEAKVVFISSPCILATKNNSGGYPLVTVFGVRFAQITHDIFGYRSDIGNALIDGNVAHYLPSLIWSARVAATGRHAGEDESMWSMMRQQLGGRFLFWTLLVPLGRFPHGVAILFFQLWRIGNRLSREIKRIKTGSVHGVSR